MLANEKSTIAIVSEDEAKVIDIITVSAKAASQGNDVTLFFILKGLTILQNKDDRFLYELILLAKKLGVRMLACSTIIDEQEIQSDNFIEGTEFTNLEAYLLAAEQAKINLVM